MAKLYEDKTLSNGKTERYVYDEEAPSKKFKAYTFDNKALKITMHMEQGFPFPVIELHGFKGLPEEFKDTGYIKNGLLNYYKSRFSGRKAKKIVIKKNGKTKVQSVTDGAVFHLAYDDFKDAVANVGKISADAKNHKTSYINNYLSKNFPESFEHDPRYHKSIARKIDSYLNDEIVEYLDSKAIAKVANFLKILMNARSDELIKEIDVLTATKKDIDIITLDKVIDEFKSLLSTEKPEKEWSNFLKKNILLIESQYVRYIHEMILSTVKARKVDFGLVDSMGHIDFFEIKKPTHRILSTSNDRGNFYWSAEATKAIVQAENYVHLAQKNGNTIINDLRREMDESFLIVSPKAYLVIGHTKEFDTNKKKDDFIMLSRSLKHVEVITYDILLKKLENQKSKILIS